MAAKKRGNARKTPEIVRFRGVEAMISFLASLYGLSDQKRCTAYKPENPYFTRVIRLFSYYLGFGFEGISPLLEKQVKTKKDAGFEPP